MALSRISSGNAANGSLTFSGTYQANDLIVLLLLNTGSATNPTTPSGYTSLTSAQDSTDGFAMAIVYKFAASGSETPPNPSNCTSIVYAIYRGVDQTTPFSGTGGQANTGTSVSWSGIVSFANPGSDWVLTFAVANAIGGNLGSHPPTSNTLVSEYKTSIDDAALYDTNAAVSSYSFNSKTIDASVHWITKTTELHAGSSGSTVTKTQSAIARIANIVTKTQTAVARIQATITKTQSAIARVQNTVTKTQAAVARIQKAITKTQSSVARIQTTVTKTQTATSRVQKTLTKTQTATANIVAGVFTKTQTAIARISKGLTLTQTGTARIQKALTSTQTAIARVSKGFTTTQPATARISTTVTKTQGAVGRIQKVLSVTQPAIARIAQAFTKTQSAIARIAISATKTQSAVGRISVTALKTQTATAHIIAGQLHKTQTATARIIGNPTIPKSYVYKVYNNGVYLGLLPSVTSEFTYSQDINTAGAQLQIVVAETADISALSSPGPITDESGNPITDESGNNLLVEGATNIVGVGTDSTLIKNGNKLVVYEFSRYYPNGKVMFSGEMERWEADFGGDNGENTITILANSDGQDLNNYILQGSPYVSDQTQTTQNSSVIVNGVNKSGGTYGVGQTFTTASGVTNVAAVDVMLQGTDTQVRVTLWPSVSAANSGSGALGSATQAVSAASATVIKFAFSSPIAVSANTQYFFTVTELTGSTINAYYENGDVYSGGDMYRQNYGGAGGDTNFHLTPYSDVTTLSDLYFTTYSSAGATTAAFSSVDPSTGIVEPIIDKYRAQGGLVNYAAGSVDTTGVTVSYTFNTATVFEGVKEALALAPSGFYFYVDAGSDTLFFKQTSTTADFVLTKGKHLSAVKIVATIENVKNQLYFSGGLVSGSNLFRLYSNNDSITKYGPRLDRQSDNRVTTSGTANAVGNSFIAANQAEQYQTTVTVLDTTMDITLLKPGKVIGYNGFGTFIDNLLMQIVRIEYHPEYVILTLGVLPPRLNPSFENLNRQLLALQTVSNPTSPS